MRNEVTLNMKEAKKLGIVNETLDGRMTVQTASRILKLSERQIYRLRRLLRAEGL